MTYRSNCCDLLQIVIVDLVRFLNHIFAQLKPFKSCLLVTNLANTTLYGLFVQLRRIASSWRTAVSASSVWIAWHFLIDTVEPIVF